jgi:phage regulator Rha-like protein
MNNVMMTDSNTDEPTMSSREIQVVIGSRHDTVKLTIERLADRG